MLALIEWFSYFPEFLPNDFYITGESYAGIYVPLLANSVLEYNELAPSNFQFNLKGIMVGNGVTDWNVDATVAWPYFLYWHGIIDDTIWIPWNNQDCSALYLNTQGCINLYSKMLNLFTNINYYDVYRECIHPDYSKPPQYTRWNQEKLQGVLNCAPDNGLTAYMNLPKVRNALHINNTLGAWTECVDLDYQVDYKLGSYYVYPNLIKSGININIYSGDTDSSVPTIGTRAWLYNLNIPVAVNWTEWFLDDQVAGSFIRYGPNLRFNTIRGTGHMSIQWKRPEGYQMFLNFIQGKDFA